MKTLCCAILLTLVLQFAPAQSQLVKQWDRRYGSSYEDQFTCLKHTSDGGYILGGYSYTTIASWEHSEPSRGYVDYWILKLDSAGIKQWDKTFGGADGDYLNSLQQTRDGGYIFGGSSDSDSSGDKTQNARGYYEDYWIIKTDSAGHKQWDKRFGGISTDHLRSVIQTDDGGYISGGYSTSPVSGDKTQPVQGPNSFADYWIVRTDSAGNKLWDKRFGGDDWDELRALYLTSDGGFILGGFSMSGVEGDKTEPGRGNFDYWIVKVDAAGNKQWDKTYGGNFYDELSAVVQTPGGEYYIAGRSTSDLSGDKTEPSWAGSYDYWLVKMDSAGNKLWDHRYGGLDSENEPRIIQTYGGGLLLAGSSGSGIGGDKTENNLGNNLGNYQMWAIALDANGVKQWDKTIFTTGSDAGFPDAVQSSDGCYLFANSTEAGAGGYKTSSSHGSYDFWMVKFCDTTLTITCNLQPPAINADQTVFCAGEGAQICAPVGFTNYRWNNGSTARCISESAAGNYYVTVTDNFGCTAESNHLALNSFPPSPVSISVQGDTLTVYHAVAQQWYLNGDTIAGATDSMYVATQGGSYTVTATDSNGCNTNSSPILISGMEPVNPEEMVVVYPNPTQNNWQVETGGGFMNGTAEVSDASGKVVFRTKIVESKFTIAPGVLNGIYLLRLSSQKSSVTYKLVKL